MKAVIVIPTYNEAGNIIDIVNRVLAVDPGYHALVVDDSSPDGTAELVSRYAERHPRTHLLLRTADRGLGAALRDGFLEALRLGAELVGQMDADGSHDPAEFTEMADLVEKGEADVVIGSRYLATSRIEGWGPLRYANSSVANQLGRFITRIPITDATNGLRLFRHEVLNTIDLTNLISRGYSGILETNYRAYRAGFRLHEIPITFHPRREGESKMSLREVIRFCSILLQLRFRTQFGNTKPKERGSKSTLKQAG